MVPSDAYVLLAQEAAAVGAALRRVHHGSHDGRRVRQVAHPTLHARENEPLVQTFGIRNKWHRLSA